MKQAISSKQDGRLISYAMSKLTPGVFAHPVWVRFQRNNLVLPNIIQKLRIEVEQLQRDNPTDACQVLILCAVYENYAGQRSGALITLQKAMELAQQNGLSQGILWAIWGSCAICIQQGQYQQAAIYFGHLQAALCEQNEWILADYIDVVRQFFPGAGALGAEHCSESTQSQEFELLLTSTLDMLYGWGLTAQPVANVPLGEHTSNVSEDEHITQSAASTQNQPGPWHTLKLIFSGELKFHWQNASLYTKSHSSFWGSVLSSLRLYFAGQKNDDSVDDRVIDLIPQSTNGFTADSATESFLPSMPTGVPELDTKNKPIEAKQYVADTPTVTAVSVHMLGKFELTIEDVVLKLPTSHSLSILKYLILNHNENTPREVLMDMFWPNAEPETARNNLNVAMHSIRRALRSVIDRRVIVHKNGAYSIDPDIQIWLDVEEFERLVKTGKRFESRNQLAAVSEYEAAISIYQGDFLQENLYEQWTILTREHLRAAYLDILNRLSQIYFNQERYAACITVCQRVLSYDRCREDAYYLLMYCYSRQGQYQLALREFQNCVKALRAELEVEPAPETVQLYNCIRRRERV